MASLSAQAEVVVVAGWDFSQYIGDGFNSIDPVNFETTNTLDANYAAFAVGANFGLPLGPNAAPFGTLYYDGSFGSTNVTVNFATDPIVPAIVPGFISLQSNRFAGPGTGYESIESVKAEGQVEGQAALALLSRNATNTVVFEATLASISETAGNWGIHFASLSRVNATGTVEAEFSTDGAASWTDPQTVTVTGVDTAYVISGPSTVAESVLVRLKLTDGVFLDSVGVTGEVGASESASWWSASPVGSTGWRFSGQGYDEPGIGWIWDAFWPWVYTTGVGDGSTGQWIYIFPNFGDRSGFYAYVNDGGYWIYGISEYGYYYSFESGSEGWSLFSR